MQVRDECLKMDRLTAELLRQTFRPFKSAIGNHHSFGAAVKKMLGGKLTHFAGADEHNGLVGQVAQNLFGQLYSGKRNGYGG